MINIFTILILTHFISDWFLQPSKWAKNKIKIFKYRFFHCIQYSILFIPVLYFLQINLLWVLWIFITHLYIDSYRFVKWWNKNITKSNKPPLWFMIVQDQILHILVLIPVVIFP